VENVSWGDCQAFCAKLSQTTGKPFRLPTEAEWEYACLAGSATAYFFGNDPKQLSDYAWYVNNSGNKTHEVCTKKPNAWGLFDMHGNVCEWCQDGYGPYPQGYGRININDPQSGNNGDARVVRGGSWLFAMWSCRAACRSKFAPGLRTHDQGLRVCFLLD